MHYCNGLQSQESRERSEVAKTFPRYISHAKNVQVEEGKTKKQKIFSVCRRREKEIKNFNTILFFFETKSDFFHFGSNFHIRKTAIELYKVTSDG